jgi:hypothetical protein
MPGRKLQGAVEMVIETLEHSEDFYTLNSKRHFRKQLKHFHGRDLHFRGVPERLHISFELLFGRNRRAEYLAHVTPVLPHSPVVGFAKIACFEGL